MGLPNVNGAACSCRPARQQLSQVGWMPDTSQGVGTGPQGTSSESATFAPPTIAAARYRTQPLRALLLSRHIAQAVGNCESRQPGIAPSRPNVFSISTS